MNGIEIIKKLPGTWGCQTLRVLEMLDRLGGMSREQLIGELGCLVIDRSVNQLAKQGFLKVTGGNRGSGHCQPGQPVHVELRADGKKVIGALFRDLDRVAVSKLDPRLPLRVLVLLFHLEPEPGLTVLNMPSDGLPGRNAKKSAVHMAEKVGLIDRYGKWNMCLMLSRKGCEFLADLKVGANTKGAVA